MGIKKIRWGKKNTNWGEKSQEKNKEGITEE